MAKPPVAKLMDFGKYKYEAAVKAREARKNQVNTVIKEIKLRPKIDPHDYETKKGHVVRFLSAGDKVKVTIMFRGREQSRPELGFRLLQRLAEDVVELGFVESQAKQDGRNMIMVLGPTKKKAEAKAEQRKRRDAAEATATGARHTRHAEAPATRPATAEPGVLDEPAAPAATGPAPASPAPAAPAPASAAPAPAAGPAVAESAASAAESAEPAAQPVAATATSTTPETSQPSSAAAPSAPLPTPPKPRPAPPKDSAKPRPGSGPVPAPPRSRARA